MYMKMHVNLGLGFIHLALACADLLITTNSCKLFYRNCKMCRASHSLSV